MTSRMAVVGCGAAEGSEIAVSTAVAVDSTALGSTALGVEPFLISSAVGSLVVPLASLIVGEPFVKLSASEGATEVDPAGIPRMGEEASTALSAAYGAIEQIGA